ncbi:hypothetical protein [Streptomyces sp. NBC_01589]|uniref:hypothetical protein n=1 Tax=unclassified Streptomyces TaxID=2593676 RepID=UPI00386A30AC
MDGAVVGAVVVVCVLLVLRSGMRVVNQVDRGVVFRFGKALPGHRPPGITFCRGRPRPSGNGAPG